MVMAGIREIGVVPTIPLQAIENGEIVIEIQIPVHANPAHVFATVRMIRDAR